MGKYYNARLINELTEARCALDCCHCHEIMKHVVDIQRSQVRDQKRLIIWAPLFFFYHILTAIIWSAKRRWAEEEAALAGFWTQRGLIRFCFLFPAALRPSAVPNKTVRIAYGPLSWIYYASVHQVGEKKENMIPQTKNRWPPFLVLPFSTPIAL